MLLYFCVAEFSQVEHMYQFSLTWFLNLFVNALKDAEKSNDIDTRILNINEMLTFSVYYQVSSSIHQVRTLICIAHRVRNTHYCSLS